MSCHVSKWAAIIHMKPHSSIWTPSSPMSLHFSKWATTYQFEPPHLHCAPTITSPMSQHTPIKPPLHMIYLISDELPNLQWATLSSSCYVPPRSYLICNELTYLQWATLSPMSYIIFNELPYLRRASLSPTSYLISNERPYLQWATSSPMSFLISSELL